MDGSNAYYCERCDKKVDTTKRLCVKKLPPILVIQLKRFDYDYDRECAVKFNDYFEFPRDLDMEPYTGEQKHSTQCKLGTSYVQNLIHIQKNEILQFNKKKSQNRL